MIRNWSRILTPFAVTRGSLLIVGLLASHLLISGLSLQKGNLVYHQPGIAPLEIWARWDAEWYLMIAERGYRAEDDYIGLPVAYRPGDATGFFPLYPLAIRALALVGVPILLGGVLVSNLALLLALWFLWNLVRRDFGEAAAQRVVWILLAYPTSFFLSAVYAESLMLCCGLAALWLGRRERPWLAGLAAGLCVLARPTGVLFLIPLVDELVFRVPFTYWRDAPRRFAGRVVAVLFPSGAALGAYMAYCHAITGSFIPFLLRQERWRGPTSGPWRAFERYFHEPALHGAHNSTIDLVCALLFVASIPFLFRYLRRSYALYACAAILLPLGSSLWSFSRFSAAIFPFHILIAALTARHQHGLSVYLGLALPLAGFLMGLYASWWWVG